MQKTEGFIEKRSNLPMFQANVGEGKSRHFQYDAHIPALYTDVKTTNEQGGFDTEVEVAITPADKDEFSVRCWEMTAPFRAKYDADHANSNGKPPDEQPTEGPGIPIQEEVADSTPVITEAERQGITDIREIPPNLTPPDPQGTFAQPQPNLISEDDMVAAVIMTNQRAAIDDLYALVDLYVEDEKAQKFADRIYERLGRLYDDYGLGNSNPATQGSDRSGDDDAEG